MSNAVDAYLDQLFDSLAGSGARGRRVLMEAQAHLEEAVERAIECGQSREAAERAAISRFGSPEDIARGHADAGTLPFLETFARVLTAGWLMASIAGLAVGLAGLLNALFSRALDLTVVPEVTRPLVVGGFALVLLTLFIAARRSSALRAFTRLPNAAMLSTAGAVGFGGLGLVLLAYGALAFVLGERGEVGEHLADGLAGVAASIAFLPRAWRQARVADA